MSPGNSMRTVGGICCVFFMCLLAGCASTRPPSLPEPAVSSPPESPTQSVSQRLMEQYALWKGVPHRLGGNDRRGVDCSGLVQRVFADAFGLDLPRTSLELSHAGYGVTLTAMMPGDIVYFDNKRMGHVGVIVQNHTFLHASASRGVILSRLDRYWLSQLVCIRRVLSDP